MISTENCTFCTVFTVSDTPSSVTEPLAAMKRASSRRGAQVEPRHVGQIVTADDNGDAVDMAGNDMAAEFVADFQRPLEIEPGADTPMPCRGHAQGLGGGVDLEPGPAAGHAGSDHGEAHAVAGDRCAVDDAGAFVAAGDAQPVQLALRGRRQRNNLANVGDNAGEHQARS